MVGSGKEMDIERLVFQKKWLATKLQVMQPDTIESAALLNEIENLDFKIAATPCDTIRGLALKLEEFADLMYPSEQTLQEDCLEHIYLAAMLRDARALGR